MTIKSSTPLRARGALLDVRACAEYIGTSERHVRRLVSERRIPFVKLGPGKTARLRFDTAKLDAWLDEHSHEPSHVE
jgi:excisionase family DNA binding protein